MKKRITIYGGTELSAAESWFVVSLTYALLLHADVVIVTGGFLFSNKNPGAISTDFSVLQGAIQYATEKKMDLKDCLETWLPDEDVENDFYKKDVERFKEGTVKKLTGKSAQARRFSMVKDVDIVITVKGRKYTSIVLDFALTINKPALPLAFTGGDSLRFWNARKDHIKQWFGITGEFASELEIKKTEAWTPSEKNEIIRKITQAIDTGIKKELVNVENYQRVMKEWKSEDDPDQKQVSKQLNAVSARQGTKKKSGADIEVENSINNEWPVKKKLNLFLSYSHADEKLKEQLDKHLTALKRSDKISVWNDRKLGGGVNWDETIKEELRNADMILLLISADFMASGYIWDVELKYALQNHEQDKPNKPKVIPIFLRHVDLEGMSFAKLQGYISEDRPITAYPEREQDEAFLQVVRGIRKDIENWGKK